MKIMIIAVSLCYSFNLYSAENPFHKAITCRDRKAISELIEKEKSLINEADIYGQTPLHLAVKLQDTETVKALLEAKADVFIQNMYGDTPLHTATYTDSRDTFHQTLGVCVSDIFFSEVHYHTKKCCVTVKGSSEIVYLLIEAGADVNAENNIKETPLIIATQHDLKIIVNILLKKGSRVNATSNSKWTPLHIAAQHNHVSIAEALLKAGADEHVKNDEGKKPLDLADEHTRSRLEEVIKKRNEQMLEVKNGGL